MTSSNYRYQRSMSLDQETIREWKYRVQKYTNEIEILDICQHQTIEEFKELYLQKMQKEIMKKAKSSIAKQRREDIQRNYPYIYQLKRLLRNQNLKYNNKKRK